MVTTDRHGTRSSEARLHRAGEPLIVTKHDECAVFEGRVLEATTAAKLGLTSAEARLITGVELARPECKADRKTAHSAVAY